LDRPAIAEPVTCNGDVPWDRFDSETYYRNNYVRLLPEDRQILSLAGDFLVNHFQGRSRAKNAVDVGSGSNLYPALLMLPWVERMTLSDWSSANVAWLGRNLAESERQLTEPWPWQPFWDVVGSRPGYREIASPQSLLPQLATVRRLSVLDLEPRAWDLGSMFFVADGMTGAPAEFTQAIRVFLAALRPGSPFVAAFMRASKGYRVADLSLPAVEVNHTTLNQAFAVANYQIWQTERTTSVVRPGYDGMLVVTGIAD
jgi:hypothetical protein